MPLDNSGKSVEKVFILYREQFLPIYADLIALQGVKPMQILIEESNFLSHLCQFYNDTLDEDTRNDNLIKSENHLIRAVIDLNKLVWASLRSKLDQLIIAQPTKRLSFNLPEEDVLNGFKQFFDRGREARKFEMQNIGNNPISCVEYYQRATRIGVELFEKVDVLKVAKINSWTAIVKTKEFLFGVAASIVATILCGGAVWIFH
ncbi:MAG: hypothetical protein HQK88_12135 [Nitrospirae bacterium]|nr:hypothetical protein [Nitrospirota bacterium]MBF0535725.1 hypothetical protein [Nitrospirota bacterium]MBF0617550.1 hypothetical protein [Nitrospirota bacterium]